MRKKRILTLTIGLLVILIAWSTLKPHEVIPLPPDDELTTNDTMTTTLTQDTSMKIYKDIAYGEQALETFDVYAPQDAIDAPIIVMVHGGGWAIGDKTSMRVVDNKVNYWLPRGYIFISINYPMLPDTPPDTQADAVARALAYIQTNAPTWGGDSSQMIVMGHSAGGHLVALVSAKQDSYGLNAWSGSVILDGAGYNIKEFMENDPTDIYINAFGTDPSYWILTSPYHQFQTPHEPLMLVCSSKRRAESSCDPAHAYAEKVNGAGGNAAVLAERFSHADINEQLGSDSEYTSYVDDFINKVLQAR